MHDFDWLIPMNIMEWNAQNGCKWYNTCCFPQINRTAMKGETPENFFEFTIAEKRWKMHTFDWIILVNMQTLENIMFSRIYTH